MPPIIKVENVSKEFIISHEAPEKYTTLRDVLAKKAKKIFSFSNSNTAHAKSVTRESFMALKDICFEVSKGDRLAIIGRNGAGKSTLLKVLSRITDPTAGRIQINGRVASLLEVGTGFHPELTGRENIFLNGAILGMSRNEIKQKFDEIVDFAEIEKFLDTPVKRYSSGMYVRLAFAVAAHLEPEILIVDEVLAVGDAQFQKKCLGKMEDVSKNEGRTVLFVSHNLPAVRKLCTTGIYIKKGEVAANSDIESVLKKYKQEFNSYTLEFKNLENEHLGITGIKVCTEDGSDDLYFDKDIFIKTSFQLKCRNKSIAFSYQVFNDEDILLFEAFVPFANNENSEERAYNVSIKIPQNTLNSGEYYAKLIFAEDQKYILLNTDAILRFTINDNLTRVGNSLNRIPGIIRPMITYDID